MITLVLILCLSLCLAIQDDPESYLKTLDSLTGPLDSLTGPLDTNECGLDPDVGLNMWEIVGKRGYQLETHYVTTEDGYILTVFRIPGPQGSPPVLLQHGLLDSSYTWVSNFQNQSLAYLLSDSKFDVWMGNNRGNKWGRNHTTLNPDIPNPRFGEKNPFWEFTYDEMAKYDTPAMIEYILEQTGKSSLGHVGHSEGTMQIFAGGSLGIQAYSKLNLFVALAPVGSIANIKSPELVALAHTNLAQVLIAQGLQEFWPTQEPYNVMDAKLAEKHPEMVVAGLDTLCGPSIGNLNKTRIQVYVSETPAGTSVMNMNHFIQGIVDKEGLFRMYDYGSAALNEQHYGTGAPPIYDLGNFKIPTALFSGSRDWMADPKDVQKLSDGIDSQYIVKSQVQANFAHLDYVWSPNAAELVYKPAIQLLLEHAH